VQNGGEEWFLPTTSINTWVGDAQDLTLNAECSMLLTPMVDAELTPKQCTVAAAQSLIVIRSFLPIPLLFPSASSLMLTLFSFVFRPHVADAVVFHTKKSG